ncbi:MAG: hypothetical protein NTY09_10005 [bacterium]|nr:hypothetical protein [bacterium]
MSHKKYLLPVLFAVIIGLILPCSAISCNNGAAVVPDSNNTALIQPAPEVDSGSHQIPVTPGNSSLQMINGNELTATSIDDLAGTISDLQHNGGGVTTFDLGEGVLVLHVFDSFHGHVFSSQALVKSGDGTSSLWSINGYAVFVNAVFPVTVSVYADGYALATIVETSANVLSIPLRRIDEPSKATIFGVAGTHGYPRMSLYSDTLLPKCITNSPVSHDGNYQSFEFDVDPYVTNGMSAFLLGGVDLPNNHAGYQIFSLPAFRMTNHFAWDLGRLNSDERLFHMVDYHLGVAPAGVVSGEVALPYEYCGEKIDALEGARIWALPTAILLDGERYLAVGPHDVLEGDDPKKLEYRCPWFESQIPEDRLVLAAQFELADGSADIVHAIWHGEDSLDPIAFSGIPILNVSGFTVGTGFSYPTFEIQDPLGADGRLQKIHAWADGVGPVWDITKTGGIEPIDTADYDIPLTWLRDLLGFPNVEFRVECINALDQSIDEYTYNDIIMRRNEVLFSAWTGPAD